MSITKALEPQSCSDLVFTGEEEGRGGSASILLNDILILESEWGGIRQPCGPGGGAEAESVPPGDSLQSLASGAHLERREEGRQNADETRGA